MEQDLIELIGKSCIYNQIIWEFLGDLKFGRKSNQKFMLLRSEFRIFKRRVGLLTENSVVDGVAEEEVEAEAAAFFLLCNVSEKKVWPVKVFNIIQFPVQLWLSWRFSYCSSHWLTLYTSRVSPQEEDWQKDQLLMSSHVSCSFSDENRSAFFLSKLELNSVLQD